MITKLAVLLKWCLMWLYVLQAEEKKLLLAQGGQSLPPGMTEVSEEEDLQAAEEVRYTTRLWCVYTECPLVSAFKWIIE